jgi:hypothetical protein
VIEVSVEQLKAATEAVLAVARDGGGEGVGVQKLVEGPARFFRGFKWRGCITIVPGEGQHTVEYSVGLELVDEGRFDVCADQLIVCKATFLALQRPTIAVQRAARRFESISAIHGCAHRIGHVCHWGDFWGLGPQAGWDPAAWQAKGLLLDGGKVKVRLTLT